MDTIAALRDKLRNGSLDSLLEALYPGRGLEAVKSRYSEVISEFEVLYGTGREGVLISAPGRTEVGGNHTDHQQGNVLAAAVDLDIIAAASPRDGTGVSLQSENFEVDNLDISNLTADQTERGSIALIRGVAAWLSQHGYKIGGFDAYTTSDVLNGSGLSSSAAFEIVVGQIFNHLYNDGRISAMELAIAGQYAENVYVGKPSGLMDQMASSVGGFVQIDFADPQKPVVTPVDFRMSGYNLCIVDTGGSHADLTPAYAAIPTEMRAVAAALGGTVLRHVDEREFYRRIGELRASCGDRAVLRAIHFFADNRRAVDMAAALKSDDFQCFLALVEASGASSLACLQNIYARPEEQGISLALALSKRVLAPAGGVCRVHGGGFAGTIQAYVPDSVLDKYKLEINALFGEGSCHVLSIRPYGGICVNDN